MKSVRPRKRRSRPKTKRSFADIRRECEANLSRGKRLNFDQIMAEIAALRESTKK
jgi:hypothetical protein